MSRVGGFTPDEESLILTCIANGIPLCCEANAHTLRAIIKPKRRREQFEEFAHENLGCTFDFEDYPSTWERYLEKTIAWFDDLCGADHGAPTQRRRTRPR